MTHADALKQSGDQNRNVTMSPIMMERGAVRPRSFPELDKHEFGLMPLDLEIWMGFIVIRYRKGPQPAVAELMVPSWGIWTQKSLANSQ